MKYETRKEKVKRDQITKSNWDGIHRRGLQLLLSGVCMRLNAYDTEMEFGVKTMRDHVVGVAVLRPL